MELRSKRILSTESLPGGNRRGTPGAGAGCSSMRSAGDKALNRRALVDKFTTAETLRDSTSPLSTDHSLFPSPNSSPKYYETQFSSSPTSKSDISVDVAQETNSVTLSAPTTSKYKKTRMKWTDEYNEAILRSYYSITKLESVKISYRKLLHTKFIQTFPDLTHVTEQRVADQKRLIFRNKLVSEEKHAQIKREIAQELQITTGNETLTQQSYCSLPTTTANDSSCRMRWDDTLNKNVMRCYYIVTELETNMSAYRTKLHLKFTDMYPDLSHISQQRLSDQRRSIVNNKLVPLNELQDIKAEVAHLLKSNNTADFLSNNNTQEPCFLPNSETLDNSLLPVDIDHSENTQTLNLPNQTLTTTLDSQITTTTQNIRVQTYETEPCENSQEIDDIFKNALDTFANTEPTKRPYIPKQKTSKKFFKIVNYINTTLLPKHVDGDSDFLTLQSIMYVAAWTAAKANGTRLLETTTPNTRQAQTHRKPKWEIRLEKKREDLRVKIGRLTQYINGNRNETLTKQIEDIMNQYKTHSVHEEPNTEPTHFLDTLKQKLTVITSRLNRYQACTLRKLQNTQFSNNEKGFYRNLKTSTANTHTNNTAPLNTPTPDELRNFWAEIWEMPKNHNNEADWIKTEHERNINIAPMEFEYVPIETFQDVIRKLHNWKAPGSDNLHNFWYKKFTHVHPFLHNYINKFIHDPHTVPDYIMTGITHMIPKDPADLSNPAKYRPITCLQTFYKIISSCITDIVHKHIHSNNILAEQQKGCRRLSQGCKEQLIIDSVILRQVHKNKGELHSMYIDYRKAYDSVPHSWLLKVLDIYKINPLITHFLQTAMQKWKTSLKMSDTQTEPIAIKRGIFQGDSFSPLWFCLALNPLSNTLNHTEIGYPIMHNHSEQLANLTENFSKDICMDFGIDKCKINSVKAGQIIQNINYQLDTGQQITSLDHNEVYKYLGYNQARQIQYKDTKTKLLQQFKHRLNSICKSQLYSRNLVKAINSYAIPILTYSFGIINWTQTDLINIQRTINTTMTKNRKHHPRACIQRQTLPRYEGGRGLIDVSNLHNKQITSLRNYFHQKALESFIHHAIVQTDKKLTPLNLTDKNTQNNEKQTDVPTKLNAWTQKSLHGRHRKDLCQNNVDKTASNAWLSCGELFPETEGFMIAIQDQTIETRNYQKYIMKQRIPTDQCRKCNSSSETIQHITGACKSIVQTDYKHRHDQVANIIHQKLAKKYHLIPQTLTPYYKYTPEPVLENSNYRLYFDRAILTDKTTHYNRPDITLQDKKNHKAYIIDIAIPNSHNMQNTISEKLTKYTDLKDEIKRMWRLAEVTIVPIVISTTGIIPRQLHQSLNTLQLPKYTYIQLQKAVILNTCRIVRKFLQQDCLSQSISQQTTSPLQHYTLSETNSNTALARTEQPFLESSNSNTSTQ
ncbi:hypothetical protein ABMA28_010737 [Loxostege sticticalis]|uniref:Reverse transcriptase domain-containing protein n=1 Tax=Loxostege sticticalis TaxID=481309 RepID=A0ABD0SBD1_LOXSC